MTNRIGGDYSFEALEAFRAAYADQLITPEDMDTDRLSGMPTSNFSNTAPWHGFVPTWKYPSGRGPESDLKQPFNPGEYLPAKEEEMTDEEMEGYLSTLTDEELDALLADIEGEHEVENVDQIGETDDTLSDDEIDTLIDEIFASDEEEG